MRKTRALAFTAVATTLLAACATTPSGGPMSFFVTSVGSGKGADLGGLAGADAHCQRLASAANAGGNRQLLVEREAPAFKILDAVAERRRCFQHQIIGRRAAGRRIGPPDVERGFAGGFERQRVGEIGEDDQAFKLVIAVGAAADDAQSQVDLGAGGFGEEHNVTRLIATTINPSS